MSADNREKLAKALLAQEGLDKATLDWDSAPRVGLGMEIHKTSGWGQVGYHLARRINARNIAVTAVRGINDLSFTTDDHKALPGVTVDLDIGQPYRVIWSLGNFPATVTPPHYRPYKDGDSLIFCFEQLPTPEDIELLRRFDGSMTVMSTWNQEVLKAHGIMSRVAYQGVDLTTFRPAPKVPSMFDEDAFVIFSGGKAELRKGQDIVLAAFKAFHSRHRDARLLTMWYNHWPETSESLLQSRLIDSSKFPTGPYPSEVLANWAFCAGIDVSIWQDIGHTGHGGMLRALRGADVALFPNRCEGATNMVAMECLAAGVPCLLSMNSGHMDLHKTPVPAFYLERQTPCEYPEANEHWRESDIDEIVESLEYLYQKRGDARHVGQMGAEQMSKFDWDVCADQMIEAHRVGMSGDKLQEAVARTLNEVREDQTVHALQYSDLAVGLRDIGFHKAAYAAIRRARRMAPNNPVIMGNLGNILLSSGKSAASRNWTEKALAALPAQRVQYTHNIALSMMYEGRFQAAYDKLQEVKGTTIDAGFDFGATLMLLGRWDEGWKAMEIRRLRHPEKHPRYSMPEWEGQPFLGTLWVTAEQGLGDIFMFTRYLPWARTLCDRLILSVQPQLMPLFYDFPGVDELRSMDFNVPDPKAQFHVPMQSLATYHGTMPSTVPPVPEHWRKIAGNIMAEMKGPPGCAKVGICWAGSSTHARDYERSMAFEQMLPLAEIPTVCLYSFQVGEHAIDVKNAGADRLVSDISESLTTWFQTAAALLQLDLLITVDTAVAHMAGNLGVPTWLLLHKLPDWRWLGSGETTTWYTKHKLIRQKKANDWDEVITRVAAMLTDFSA